MTPFTRQKRLLRRDSGRTVQVDGGELKGVLSADKTIEIYKGIPFAAPPVGDLRWKAPQPVEPWNGVKNCTEYSTSAIQAQQSAFMFWSTEFIIDTSKGYSEDCLYLNVWNEKYTRNEKRPVVVYIHGGGNVSGGASCDVYDGEAMVKKDVVYVTINYRLGILGFLAHPELSAESSDKISGNYAIQDQIAALEWVKRNISQFGGDPDNVTIAGQSAGSFNVHSLVSSPMAAGLFKNAVAMSGNPIEGKLPTLAEKEQQGKATFADKTLDEMRAMTTDEILKHAPAYSSSTCIDGKVITASVFDSCKSGTAANVAAYSSSTCIDGKVITASVFDSYKSGTANKVNMMTGMVDGVLPFMHVDRRAAAEVSCSARDKTAASL